MCLSFDLGAFRGAWDAKCAIHPNVITPFSPLTRPGEYSHGTIRSLSRHYLLGIWTVLFPRDRLASRQVQKKS